LMPDVDPESLRAKMTKTGDLEAVVFNKLFEFSEKADALLTAEQRKTLQELKHRQAAKATHSRSQTPHMSLHQDRANGHVRFEFFLDQIGALKLSDAQVAALVSLKDETQKATLLDKAKLKALELDLLDQLSRLDAHATSLNDALITAVQQLEKTRAKMVHARLEAYLKARQILTPEQRAHVQPVEPLLESS
jgi:Spy/CpxP family protein refolding chaperone